MCGFCEKIIDVNSGYLDALQNGNDFIFKDNDGHLLRINTGDSGCPGVMEINYCPMCGRKL